MKLIIEIKRDKYGLTSLFINELRLEVERILEAILIGLFLILISENSNFIFLLPTVVVLGILLNRQVQIYETIKKKNSL